MASTLVALQTVTVGAGGAASISFTSIPQTYNDLVIKASSRATNSTITYTLAFNSSSSGYSQKVLYGDGTNPGTQGLTAQTVIYGYAQNSSAYTANTFNNICIDLPSFYSFRVYDSSNV